MRIRRWLPRVLFSLLAAVAAEAVAPEGMVQPDRAGRHGGREVLAAVPEATGYTLGGRDLEVEGLAEDTQPGTAYALVVGIDDYQDERISDLRYAETDARAVVAALTDPQRGIVAPENARLLTGAQATYRNIAVALEEQLVRRASKPEDVVFFYFAGHGAEGPHLSRGAAYYLVPHDADAGNLLSTAIEKGRLQFLWGAVGAARKVFITDACHSGGMQDMRVLTARGFETVEGFVTLAAAQADQRSWELPRLGHGIFTYALAQGLQGAADRDGGNGDGFVSVAELGEYLQVQVGRLAAEVGAEQAPVVDLVPGAGEVLLGTSGGQQLPAWMPMAGPSPMPVAGPIRVAMRFKEKGEKPRVLVVVRDEDGNEALAQVATAAIANRFLETSDAFRLVDPGAVFVALGEERAALAFSAAPGDLAAVARAVEADLILTGQFVTRDAGAAAAELLGTAVKSFQAQLNGRAVLAGSGEVVQAANVQQPGMHLEPEMARRQALEKAGAALADRLMGPMLERWTEWRRVRPAGRLTVEGVREYATLVALAEALATLAPAVRELQWRSAAGDQAEFEFETSARPEEVAGQLKQSGLPGFKVDQVKASQARLSFVVHR